MTDQKDVFSDVGVTFDDVLLEPQYSTVIPADVNVKTKLTKNITLNVPLLSSPMDTVTERRMAVALAQEGGVGIIHKNLPLEVQAEEVAQVKRTANGIIRNPATMQPDASVRVVREMMEQQNVSGVPIVQKDVKLVGIITKRDLRFLEDWDQPVA